MNKINRRQFIEAAGVLGAAAVWCRPTARGSAPVDERRDLYPEGVASGDPDHSSVILWTRRPYGDGRQRARLRVQVATDEEFSHLIANTLVPIVAEADWTARVLVGGMEPSRVYWYRFVDEEGLASRVGRTMTAPRPDDGRPIRFAFVSCQNANQGAQNAWRRMIYDDEAAHPDDRIEFVLNLGDFIYEVVWYPEDRPQGYYARRLRPIVHYASGRKIRDFHVPGSLDDYRAVYQAYLHDLDIQDARARWPLVSIWDNHEFSWLGWQSFQQFNGEDIPAQTLKVAANQAWFEYQPARVANPGSRSLERFERPQVANTPIERFDDAGLGQEPNNLAAIHSLKGYRALRWGKHLDLLVTDQRSYRSQDPIGHREARAVANQDFLGWSPQEAFEVLDAGRSYDQGRPPETIALGKTTIPNFRRNAPPQTLLGAEQKRWFLDRLKRSTATWKIWGNTLGTLDYRVDPLNLPEVLAAGWTGAGYGVVGGGDFGTAYTERGEIYDFIRDAGITGFAIVSGDRHSFWAGLAAKALPPKRFEPVGVAFVTGSLSSPGLAEASEYNVPKNHPLRPIYMVDRPGQPRPEPNVNLLLMHGVRSSLEYARSGDIDRARALSNADLSPHLAFLDLGGHGFSKVRLDAETLDVEFVGIPRPLERSDRADGGPVLYRVRHRAKRWGKGEAPRLEQVLVEGNPVLSLAGSASRSRSEG